MEIYRVGVVALIVGSFSIVQVNAQVSFQQPFPKPPLPQYIQKPAKPFPSIPEEIAVHRSGSNPAAARKQDEHKLPLGYRKESWKPELNAFSLDARKTIVASDDEAGVIRAYRLSLTDTTGIEKISFPGAFTNTDAFNFLAGSDGTDLPFFPSIRPQPDRTIYDFTALLIRTRKDGQLITTRSLKREEAFPSIFLPTETYSVMDNCSTVGNRFILTSTGKLNNDLWEIELLVSQLDCNTGNVVAEFKEIRLLNANVQQVEVRSYEKQNGNYSLIAHTKSEYTESGEDKSYESVLENRKYEFEHDEFGILLTSTFVRNNTEWEQTGRTTRESSTEQGKTVVVATNERLDGTDWVATYRETWHFDDQKRSEFYLMEYYVGGQWVLDVYFKTTFFKLTLPSQLEYYFKNGGTGQKEIYSYNNSDILLSIERHECTDLDDCQNGIYNPQARMTAHTSPALDYVVYYTYANGQWQGTDSTAHAYDQQGDLTEIFLQDFKSDSRTRYRLDYQPDIVAGLDDDEIDTPLAYPNPAHDELRISAPGRSAYNVFVYDITGRTVGTYSAPDAINISRYPPGVYLVLIEADGLRRWQRVVKN